MKELEPCRIGEVGVVCVGAEEFIGVCGVLEGEVGREVPEPAVVSMSDECDSLNETLGGLGGDRDALYEAESSPVL